MKYLSSIFLVSVFLLSTVSTPLYGLQLNQRMGKKVLSPGGAKSAGITYVKVAKDLVKQNMKGKLSKSELRVINDFIKGKRQNPRDVKFLESAIKKHACFVPLNRKMKNLTMFPRPNANPKWFAIDCNNSTKRGDSGRGLSGPGNNLNSNSGGGATTNNGGGATN